MIRSIAPKGHLFTFEYHLERFNAAKKEFEDHGLGDFVSVFHKNVCNEGFGQCKDIDAGKIRIFININSFFRSSISMGSYTLYKGVC